MVSARGFVWMDQNEAEHPERLWGVKEEPRPLAVQMWDNDPETLAKVGERLANEYQGQRRRYQLRLPGERRHREGPQRLVLAEISGADSARSSSRVVEACRRRR